MRGVRRLLAGAITGVVLAGATRAWPPVEWLPIALAAGAVLWLLGQRFTGAALLAGVAALAWIGHGLSMRAGLEGQPEATLAGQVVGLPVQRSDSVRFELRVTDVTDLHAGAAAAAAGNPGSLRLRRVRVDWYDAELPPAGAHCLLRVRLRAPLGFANAGGFDLAGWTLGRGIDARGSVRERLANQCVAAADGDRSSMVDRWRDRLRARLLASGWPQAGVMVALALGDGAGLTDAQWRTLRATGTVHLLVISGLHVTMVAMAAFTLVLLAVRLVPPLLRRGLARPLAVATAVPAALVYALLAGFGVPAVRALLMSGVALVAVACARPQRWWPAWLASAACVLAVQPLAWREPGCVLSFLGVGLLLWSLAVERDAPAGLLRRTVRAWWRAQWLMLLATTPLLLAWFGQAPLSSPLGNLLAGPLVSAVCVPLALLGTLATSLLPALAQHLLGVLDAALALVWSMLAWQAAEVGFLRLVGVGHVPLFAAGVLLALLPAGMPGRAPALLLAVLACALAPAPDLARGEFEVTAFDVGQGTSALVRTRSHTVLVDAGPRFSPEFDAGEAVVAPALLAHGIGRLDAVLLSHADLDHAGGFDGLRANIDVGTVFAPHADVATGVHRTCRAGTHWRWDGVDFSVLWPHEPLPGEENDRSCVLLVQGRASALLPGDIGRRVERRLLADPASPLAQVQRLHFALSGHHGSRTSSAIAFVARVAPVVVVHTAASPSRFGHPHPEVRARFDAVGSQGLVTGEVGAVTWRSERGVVRVWRCAPAHRWQTVPAACARVSRTGERGGEAPAPGASGPPR
jgi:competence protein ComEC